MTALDIMVLLALGAGAVFGLMRGFIVEVASLAAWVAGFVAVKLLHAPVAAWLTAPVGTRGGAAVLAVALLFGGAFIAVRLLGGSISNSTRKTALGGFDRVLGMGFGTLKGLFAVTLGFLLMSLVHDTVSGARAPRPDWMTQSRSYDLLRASSNALVTFVRERREGGARVDAPKS